MKDKNECTHHWIIDRPDGHTSRGICKLCNEAREFENSIDKSVWLSSKRDADGQRTIMP